MLKIWKNTSTLDNFDEGLFFTENKKEAIIALLGSKPIEIIDFPNLKGIFRAGIGKDNVPEDEAEKSGILVRYPSDSTIDIIFDETAIFTCNLIFRMLYNEIGTIEPWFKKDRIQMKNKLLLIIGTGNIGRRVYQYMKPFMKVKTFDILKNTLEEIPDLISEADCISLHIPNTIENYEFIDDEKLSMMKDNSILINTARGALVNEDALYHEISSNRLRAAFDVFWEEPYKGKLKEFHPEKFFITPHVASTCKGFLEGCRYGLDKLIGEISDA